jgi:hypothetical protein
MKKLVFDGAAGPEPDMMVCISCRDRDPKRVAFTVSPVAGLAIHYGLFSTSVLNGEATLCSLAILRGLRYFDSNGRDDASFTRAGS